MYPIGGILSGVEIFRQSTDCGSLYDYPLADSILLLQDDGHEAME